jgi:hypothetical protein
MLLLFGHPGQAEPLGHDTGHGASERIDREAAADLSLGAYLGNPGDGIDIKGFTGAVGRAPAYLTATVDQSQNFEEWPGNADYIIGGFKGGDPAFKGKIPVIGFGMADAAHGAQTNDAKAQQRAYSAITAGRYDAPFRRYIQKFVNAGYTGLYWRISYELNGNFNGWWVGDTPEQIANFNAAWRHLVALFRAADPTIKIVWNLSATGGADRRNGQNTPIDAIYPGDQWVDVIGLDLYDWGHAGSDTASKELFWDYGGAGGLGRNPGQFGMRDAIAFAIAHDKEFMICETGVDTDRPSGDLPRYLAKRLKEAAHTIKVGPTIVWDVNADHNWSFTRGAVGGGTEREATAAGWRTGFGGAR